MQAVIRHIVIGMGLVLLTACNGQPPNVKISEAPANGLTAQQMDLPWLQQLAESTRADAQQRLDETYAKNEVPPQYRTNRAEVTSSFLQVEGKKLAVVNLRYTGAPIHVARVTGIEDGQLVTVSCTDPRGAPINPLDPEGACEEVVIETFLGS